jgi:PHP family Zn ribbon phosphoesterase
MGKQRNSTGRRNGSLFSKIEKTTTPTSRNYVLDLRVHSPAALGYRGIEGLETAPALVRLARVKGLDVIGVTDFYSGEFIDKMREAAKESDLTIIPGVDIRCKIDVCEDAELTCLFPERFTSRCVKDFLSQLGIPEGVDLDSNFRVHYSFDYILEAVELLGGLILPSRIDKTPSRKSIIPLLVETYGFRAFDLAHVETEKFFLRRWPHLQFNLFSFSNATALAQVGSRIARVTLEAPSFESVKTLIEREVVLSA